MIQGEGCFIHDDGQEIEISITNNFFSIHPLFLCLHSHQSSNRFSRSALLITLTELKVIATLAIIGLSSMPKKG